MKLLMENWRDYQSQILYEQELEAFFNKHFGVLDEGIVTDVINAGRTVKDTIVNVIDDMKEWTETQIKEFVKYMGQKMETFIGQLKAVGAFGKYRAREELNAVKLLMTNKHIDLAVMIFSAIAKLSGGFIIDKVVKTPEIIEKILGLLEKPGDKLKDLLGDVSDVVKMIQDFIEFRKDLGTPAAYYRQWEDFGGLAEHLSDESPI